MARCLVQSRSRPLVQTRQAIFCEVIIFTIRRGPESWTANEEIRPVLFLMRRRLDQDTWLEGCGLISKDRNKRQQPTISQINSANHLVAQIR